MAPITLWILILMGDGHVPVVVDRFATEADCKPVAAAIERKSQAKYMSQLILALCVQAKVAR